MTSVKLIGERIKKIRKSKKMTQYDLADKVGTTHCSISNWEEGKFTERSMKNEEDYIYHSCTADNDMHGKL